MGTQQLLLIVLGLIIVGIGVVIGINIFNTGAIQAQKDAITEDCLHLAAAAQGYYRKPAMFGGGDNSFTNIDISDCGMNDVLNNSTGTNLNGTYIIEGIGDAFVVTARSRSDEEKVVIVTCDMMQPADDRISVSYTNW